MISSCAIPETRHSSRHALSTQLSTPTRTQTEMVDLLSADPQVIATVSRSKGLVVMCPPSGDSQAAAVLSAMTSAVKKGTKVKHEH